ncbi:hypothetical protein V6R86_06680 [Sphingomonas kaistensis]|uniref:Histidine kinase n=1 Tax=Sphingomonas kaistensis TaxID=298708 RepID=A0ABZ2G2Z1_9SPHN
MTLPIVALVVAASAVAVFLWRASKSKSPEVIDAARLGLAGRPLISPQQICQQAAARLGLNVVYIEQGEKGAVPVAGVPWPAHLEVIDIMAIDACLESGEPAGIGSGQHGASDWLFLPLRKDGRTLAVAGVAGPFCRRRLDPGESGMLSLRRNFERYLAERPPGSVTDASPMPLQAGPSPLPSSQPSVASGQS